MGNIAASNDFEEGRRRQDYPQHHQQQQTPSHPPHRRHQHPPDIATRLTPELLQYLEHEFLKTIEMIRNMKKDKWFDKEAKRNFLNEMIEKENLLRNFNLSMQQQSGRISDAEKSIQNLNAELKYTKNENSRLLAEKKHLDNFLTPSPREENRGTSQQSRPPGFARGQNGDELKKDKKVRATGSSDQERIRELTQKLDDTSHAFQKEKNWREEASFNVENLKQELDKMIRQNVELSEKIDALSEEKNTLVMRLSKIAGQRLAHDNPAIADLSDQNRPTKLGEMYSEIYDNEWTDAFEGLTEAGYEEEDAIMTLRLTLLNVFQFCHTKSESLLKKTEEAVNILFEEYKHTEIKNYPRHLTMPRKVAQRWGKLNRRSAFDGQLDVYVLQERWKPKAGHKAAKQNQSVLKVNKSEEVILNQLKVFRKEVAESMVPVVEKAYISASWNGREYINTLKPFIKKCILLGWMMVVQSPPMAFVNSQQGDQFNKDMYRAYTASGNTVSYVVWPALLLHESGPLVGKGVAQATKD